MPDQRNEKIRGHKLLTPELETRFAQVGRQEDVSDPLVITKYFHPLSQWTWFATEYDAQERVFFGLVDGHEREWGYFALDELEEVEVLGLPIERDLYFKEDRITKLDDLQVRETFMCFLEFS